MTDYLHTWNPSPSIDWSLIEFEDDTFRDGMQGIYQQQITLKNKIELLHSLKNIGLEHAVLSYPASSQKSLNDSKVLLDNIESTIMPWFLARTTINDLEPVIKLQESTQRPIGVSIFIGTSPIRRHVENWSFTEVLYKIETSLEFIKKHGLHFSFNLEDATRTPMHEINLILELVMQYNPYSIALCDTTGDSTPQGVTHLCSHVKKYISDLGRPCKILWHGHNDRGLALANSIAAAEAGVNIISGTFLGIGERCGNTALEQVVTFAHQMGSKKHDIKNINEHCNLLAKYAKVVIPASAAIVGKQAFATATGVHCAALLKAKRLGDNYEDYIYSSVPATLLGRQQEVYMNQNSGLSNLIYLLEKNNIEWCKKDVVSFLHHIKNNHILMSENEVIEKWRTSLD
jgi:2-isopropylmalate synthase